MTRRSGLAAAALLAVAISLSLSPAKGAAAEGGAAEQDAFPPAEVRARRDEARGHYQAGRAKLDARQYADARAEFELANTLSPTYELMYDIAQCDEGLGDLVGAIGRYEQHLAAGGAAIVPEQRTQEEAKVAALRAKLGELTVNANVIDAEVLVDDHPAGRTGVPLQINPGKRKVWATKPGYLPASTELTVDVGSKSAVVLELRPLPRGRPSAPKLGARLATYGFLVAAVLAVGAGAVVVMRRRRGKPSADPPEADVPEVAPTPDHVVPISYDPPATPAPELRLDAAVAQDVGKVKPTNEDSYLVSAEHGLYVVADGVGGNAGGGVASATAVKAIREWFDAAKRGAGRGHEALTHLPPAAAELAGAVYAANTKIRRQQAANWNLHEMGTTCIAARFVDGGGRLFVAHIGDSRAYRMRRGVLAQMTTDHTMGALGVVGPRANHLSRALGSDPCPKLDLVDAWPTPGDTYVLCSDGLTKMMTIEQLSSILAGAPSAAKAVAELVELANAQGGEDNITVVVVRISSRSR